MSDKLSPPKGRRDAARREPALAAARDAFAHGRFDASDAIARTLAPANTSEAAEVAVLRARIARARGDAEGWLAAASEAVRELEPSALRTTALALRAGAVKALGKSRDARAGFDDVLRELARFPGHSVGAARYYLALDAFENLDFARAEHFLRENLIAGVSDAESTALLGWVEVRRERYAEAGVQFTAALKKLAASGETDVPLEANAVRGLSWIGVETIDRRLLERARKADARIDWPASLRGERFAVLCHLRVASLFENDVDGAFFEAREAVAVAATPAEVVVGETNAAVTSRLLGDRHAASLQLARAWSVVRSERWHPYDDAARTALTTFAIDGALEMPGEARKALALSRSLSPKSATGASQHLDRRSVAAETMAAARVADAAGDEVAAERLYHRALDLWHALRFDLRAALVALDLRRITGDDGFAAPIRAALARAPQAWFGAQLAAQDGPLERLSAAELIVLAHLLRGETAKTIGEKLERSPFTVSNHTRKIFAAFHVNSRAKVIAICADLGITPDQVDRLAR